MRSRQRRLWIVMLVGTATITTALAETLLRLTGNGPAPEVRVWFPNEPAMHDADAVLGWRPKPGSYRYPGYTTGASPITMTFWADGARATAPIRVERSRRVILVGDSFTQGWAISDDETYAWKLQQRFPAVQVLNFGVAGYSTYQAILRLEESLRATSLPPALVLYGFNEDHPRRNVAESSWLQSLAVGRRRGVGQVGVPYCLLDREGRLVAYPPEAFRLWPLRSISAVTAFLERTYATLTSGHRDGQQARVTELLLERMSGLARDRGTRLIVVLLTYTPSGTANYARRLEQRGIPFIDCHFSPSPDLSVPGEGHPNGRANTTWAECIGAALERAGDL